VKLVKISSSQILVICFFAVTIRFLKKQARINKSHYQQETTRVSNYSVDLDISEEVVSSYLKHLRE
jgi:hypothetical protein